MRLHDEVSPRARPPERLLRRAAGALLLACAVPGTALAQGFGGTVADHLVRGDSLLAQGRSGEAIVQFQEARTLCPTPAEIVTSLQGEARGHLAQRETLPAAGLLEEAASRFPEDPRVADLLYTAGMARQQAGQLDQAVDLLRKALTRSPTPDIQPMLEFQLALALRRQGKPAEAIEAVKNFESEFPKSPLVRNVLYTMAGAQHDQGLLDAAESSYRSIIGKFAGSQAALEAHFELAAVLAQRGKRSEAAELFRKYAALSPSSPFAAKAYERAGDLLLFSSPRQSAESYALAAVKAAANPKPATDDMLLSRWIGTKTKVANLLSRVWLVVVAGGAILVVLVLGGLWIVRRRSAARAMSGAGS